MTLETLRTNFRQKGFLPGILFYLSRLYTAICTQLMRLLIAVRPEAQPVIVFKNTPKSEFSDNTLALFEYLMAEGYDQKYRMVWCVSNPRKYAGKYPDTVRFVTVEGKNNWISFRAVYYCSVAKYIFYTHNTGGLHKVRCKDQVLVNLWHGNGYKANDSNDRNPNLPNNHIFDYALVSGSVFIDTKAEFWQCNREQLLPIGFPRYDWLLKGGDRERIINSVFGKEIGDRKLLLWLPTFLQHSDTQFAEASIETGFGFSGIRSHQELIQLNEHCIRSGAVCIIKRHPSQSVWGTEGNLDAVWFLDDRQLRQAQLQLSTLLSVADALLTDFSSAAVDFLLVNRPIGFVLSDYERYRKTRGFVFENPLAYMPGAHIYSFSDLLSFVTDVAEGKDSYEAARNQAKALMHQPTDNYCKRIADALQL